MISPHLTKHRASALVDDLLVGFSSKSVERKLQTKQGELDDEASSKAWEVVKSVSADSFARYGILPGSGDEYEREEFIAATKTALETSGRKSEKLDGICNIIQVRAKTEIGTASSEQQRQGPDAEEECAIDKERLLSLQNGLLVAFSAPSFQKELHELSRLHGAPQQKSLAFKSAFQRLVRSAQLPILPSYGFEASEKGVEDMLQAFRSFRDDADIYVNAEAIKEALLISSDPFPPPGKTATSSESNLNNKQVFPPLVKKVRVTFQRSSKEALMELLRNFLVEYSTPGFQERLMRLIHRHAGGKAEGYYHLPGRAELAFEVQQKLLPSWGFDASREGVKDMLLCCSVHLGDPRVAGMYDAINAKLGMSANACQRFRRLAKNLADATTPTP
eukprot:TRINITY_DN58656_c0_g1_i1.p1 TRINITY_DN58656_c0_g1~~TRINITY_DN58656_c0_g1_i1.p1  ORF type:complete len:390 (-),score=85.35 TRINITY_DN58656_c0_g1_i1:94-1263(-)